MFALHPCGSFGKLLQKAPGGAAKTLRGTLGETFDKTFLKVFRAPAAKRRSPSAEGETSLRRFFLIVFSLRLLFAKKKRLRRLKGQPAT